VKRLSFIILPLLIFASSAFAVVTSYTVVRSPYYQLYIPTPGNPETIFMPGISNNFRLIDTALHTISLTGGGGTGIGTGWPSSVGIFNYAGNSQFGTSYNASNKIPFSFLSLNYPFLVGLWANGSCSGFLKSDGTCSAGTVVTAFADITGAPGDNTNLAAALALKAPLDSPVITGHPTVPDYLSIATAASTYMPKSGGAFTGAVTGITPAMVGAQPASSVLSTYAGIPPTADAQALLGDSAAQMLILIGAQPLNSNLTTYAGGGAPSANGLSLISAANYAAMKALQGYYTWGDNPTFGQITFNGALPSVNNTCSATSAGLYCYINGSLIGPYATSAGTLTNPMTNVGDIIYGGTSGAPTRLADVAVGSALVSNGVNTAPVYALISGFASAGDVTGTLGATTVVKLRGIALPTLAASTGLLYDNNGTFSLPTTLPATAEPAHTGDATNSVGSLVMTVSKINGVSLAGLGTGILKNTTGTGVPSIAVPGVDYEAYNANHAIGPGSSTSNHVAIFSNTDGKTLADGGASVAYTDPGSGYPKPLCATGTATTGACTNLGNIAYTQTIASGSLALATSSIASGACQTVTAGSVNSAGATGVVATDVIVFTPNGSIKAVTGYTPSTSGGLTIVMYPTVGYVNADVCNVSGSAITPGAVTLNWRVTR
jgi:hypothetical protein